MITRLHTIFKYDSKRALHALGQDLMANAPDDMTLCEMSAHIIYRNLITIPVGFAPKLVYSLLPVKLKWKVCQQLGYSMYNNGSVKKFFYKTIQHMVKGVDAYDPTSAGGWCESEFKQFLTILHEHGYSYDGEPWWLIMELEENANISLAHHASG